MNEQVQVVVGWVRVQIVPSYHRGGWRSAAENRVEWNRGLVFWVFFLRWGGGDLVRESALFAGGRI